MQANGASTILLVEDNSDDVLIFRRAIRRARITHRLVPLSNGQEAIDYLSGVGPYSDRLAHPWPVLILLDLKMPLRNGFDVLNWLGSADEFARNLPVVVLTSSDQMQDFERARQLGARAYMTKPPSPEELVRVLESVCAPPPPGPH